MTTRAEIIRKCKEILLEAIGYAEIKSDTDAYSLALKTLVDNAMEGDFTCKIATNTLVSPMTTYPAFKYEEGDK